MTTEQLDYLDQLAAAVAATAPWATEEFDAFEDEQGRRPLTVHAAAPLFHYRSAWAFGPTGTLPQTALVQPLGETQACFATREIGEFVGAAGPDVVRGLIAEIRALRAQAVAWTQMPVLPPQRAPFHPVSWAVLAQEYTGSHVLVAYNHESKQWVGLDYQPNIIRWTAIPS